MPLHCYIQLQGADINAQDIHDRTPLMLASSKGGWRTVHYLLEQGADISLRDKENRNFLHLAIKNGVPINNFGCNIIKVRILFSSSFHGSIFSPFSILNIYLQLHFFPTNKLVIKERLRTLQC